MLLERKKDLEDLEANATIVDYVEYKHSYCHALEPKLKKINYYINFKTVEKS